MCPIENRCEVQIFTETFISSKQISCLKNRRVFRYFFRPCSSILKDFKLAAAGDSAIESRVIIVGHRYISQESVLTENLLPFNKEMPYGEIKCYSLRDVPYRKSLRGQNIQQNIYFL